MNRVTVRFEGRVQGVGFRANVLDLARGFEVQGLVRNLSDGSVQLISEGESAELQKFLQSIRQRMQRNIVHENAHWEDISELEFLDFSIAASEHA